MLRKFEPAPDGSHLVKQWATEFNYLSTMWWGTSVLAQEKFTRELLQHRKELVLDLLQTDLAKRRPEALAGLSNYLLERKIYRLNAETFALGKRLLDGDVAPREAARLGKAFLTRAEDLAESLKAEAASPATEALRQRLNDAMLEALYAVERKAMSPRLARHHGDSKAPDLRI